MTKSETGVQLLARLGSRPSISGIFPKFFDGGPHPKDVIELYGAEGSAKSEILYNIIAQIILPKHWKTVDLQGHDAGVVFIDNDYKFSILRLVTLMETRVSKQVQGSRVTINLTTYDIEHLIKECLTKLYLVRCTSSSQLVITLYSLEKMLLTHADISVIMLDSVSAFYWSDKCNGGESIALQEKNMRLVTEILSKYVQELRLIVIATKCAYFNKKSREGEDSSEDLPKTKHQEFLCKQWAQFVSKHLLLEKQSTDSKCIYICDKHSKVTSENSEVKFSITETGVTFLE